MSIYADDVQLQPYWWEAAPRPSEPSQALPDRAEIVIVGSGYTGLNAALELAEAGVKVLVLDAEELGHGASTRNGGAIGATLRYSYGTLVKRVGIDQANRLYRSAIASREYVIKLVESRGFDCAFSRCGRFYGAHRKGDYDSLARDLDLRSTHLESAAVMVPRAEQRKYVGTNAYFGGRFQPEDGHLHPGLYHDALLKEVRMAGGTVLGRSRVTKVETAGSEYVVHTARGRIRAGQVLVATNAYTGSEFQWFRRRLIPIQSQIIATEELDAAVLDEVIPEDAQIGDTCKLHNYYRRSPDGLRILFGGRSGASQVDDFRKSGESLHRRLGGLFPQLKDTKITHSWGGLIAFSFDQTPHFTESKGLHYVGGCCGSGVAMMSYLGQQVARKLLGRDYDATFQKPLRSQPFYNGSPWWMPAIITTLELRDRFRI